MNECVIKWMSNEGIEWMNEWVIKWMSNGLNELRNTWVTGLPTGVCAPVPFFFPPSGTILLMRMAFSRGFDLRGMFIGWPLCISWITGYWEENSYTLSIPFSCRCIAEPDYILYILYTVQYSVHCSHLSNHINHM